MKRAVLIPVTTIFASIVVWETRSSLCEELQAIFARASVRRTERRAFVEIMRRIVAFRASLEPLLVLRLERRLVPRESVVLP